MPLRHNRKPHPLANTTPFPNGLFEWMPELKDSEWRLICLIVRGTWGWTNGSGDRKQSDWLTQKQMMKRTGRSSEALSRAVDSLVQRGLIEVHDTNEKLLASPAERRRAGGRLYFSVRIPAQKPGIKNTLRKSEEVGPKVRLSDSEAEKLLCPTEPEGGKSDAHSSKTEVLVQKSGVRKANTTKETGTKIIQKANEYTRNARGENLDLMTEEANERRFQPRLHSGWFRAGSSQPHRHSGGPPNHC